MTVLVVCITLRQKSVADTDPTLTLTCQSADADGAYTVDVVLSGLPDGAHYEAASLAVYYSQARGGGKTPVDYTMARFVRKPSGALPGMVLYTDYQTCMAESDEALAERLRVR